jgi:hypothetical protein
LKSVVKVVRSRFERFSHAWERRQQHMKICKKSYRIRKLGREQIQLVQDEEN